MFIPPMCASPLPPQFEQEIQPDAWWANEKYDGIRIGLDVSDGRSDLFTSKTITPWSRYGIVHPLPRHLMEAAAKLPVGYYDGEVFAPGKRSYGATELTNAPDLILCIFDVVELFGVNTELTPLEGRLAYLTEMQDRGLFDNQLQLAPYIPVQSWSDVATERDRVWAQDGEGLILKRRRSIYRPGKRPKDWLKIKKLQHDVLTLIGFVPSKGLINNRGNYATMVGQDKDGFITTVKTKNDAMCRRFEKLATGAPLEWWETRVLGKRLRMHVNHPEIGRKFVIEFQERTPDMNWRHPRFDRWEDE